MAAYDCRIRADCHTTLHDGLPELSLATYVGARVSVARDLSVVLNRHLDGSLELTVEPAGSAPRA